MQYHVWFGGRDFALDLSGFDGEGTVTTDGETVMISGERKDPTLRRLGLFLALLILVSVCSICLALLSVALAISIFGVSFIAAVVVASTGSSYVNLAIPKSTITDVQRNRRQIEFSGWHPETGRREWVVFSVDTEGNAARLETDIKVWQSAKRSSNELRKQK